jgi:hypothetical protein
MKNFITFCAAVALMLAVGGVAQATVIQDGADKIVASQHTDGLWGWPLTVPPTYTNITGPIGMGLITAHGQTADVDHINSAKAAGDALVGLTSDWIGSYNPLFLVELTNATGDNSYLGQAQTGFSEMQAGTYTRQSVDYDTAGFIQLVQNGRAGTWVNLLPWEFAPLALAASTAGDSTQVALFTQAMKDGIDTLDSSDPSTVYSDTLGLAGGVMGLSWLGEDFDPTSGAFAAASSTADLADILAGFQNANGSWDWHSAAPSPTSGDEDLQITAYAILALDAANDSGQYDTEIALGRSYLIGMQNIDGGWPSYPGGAEYAEIDGEIVWALAVTVPEPATMGLLCFGALSLLLVRRRR